MAAPVITEITSTPEPVAGGSPLTLEITALRKGRCLGGKVRFYKTDGTLLLCASAHPDDPDCDPVDGVTVTWRRWDQPIRVVVEGKWTKEYPEGPTTWQIRVEKSTGELSAPHDHAFSVEHDEVRFFEPSELGGHWLALSPGDDGPITAPDGPDDGVWDHRLEGGISPGAPYVWRGRYNLPYIGSNGRRDDGGPTYRRLGLALSDDGREWSRFSGNPVLAPPSFCSDEEGIFNAQALVFGDDVELYHSRIVDDDCDLEKKSVAVDGYVRVYPSGGAPLAPRLLLDHTDDSLYGTCNSDPEGESILAGVYAVGDQRNIYYLSKCGAHAWELCFASFDRSTWTRAWDGTVTCEDPGDDLADRWTIGACNPVWLDRARTKLGLILVTTVAGVGFNGRQRRLEVRTADVSTPNIVSAPIWTAGLGDHDTRFVSALLERGENGRHRWLLAYEQITAWLPDKALQSELRMVEIPVYAKA